MEIHPFLHFLSSPRERIRGEGAFIYREGKRERGVVIEGRGDFLITSFLL